MRIIAGQFRGTALASLGKGDPAAHLRPTTDRVRESLFNVLANHDVIAGARVLDLFAGTGALGLEALSRGATHVTFVDDGPRALSLIKQNIDRVKARAATSVERRDATRPGPCPSPPHDLIFLDPPYGKGLGQRALEAAEAGGWIAPEAFVIWEEAAPQMPPSPAYSLIDQRKYGDSFITLMGFAKP